MSNYVGVEPVGSFQRWDGKAKYKKDIPCPSIVLAYNENVGGGGGSGRYVDFAISNGSEDKTMVHQAFLAPGRLGEGKCLELVPSPQ